MVYFDNNKTKEELVIAFTIKSETKGSYKGSHTYTAEYLKEINFDIEICKDHIKKCIPKTNVRNYCNIINHVVASINDYKKYISC